MAEKKVEVKIDQIVDIWERAGKNEPLTPEEFELYIKEVAKRRK